MAIHIVHVKPQNVNSLTGEIVDKNDPSTTIAQVMRSDTEFRVVPDANIPNSIGSPTIANYLTLEDAAGFKAVQVSNTMIITQSESSPS